MQVAIPRGGEDEARAFWGDLLGMEEIEKPPALAARGGCWFRLGTAEIHCGVEEPFTPARKAHPALEVDDLEGLVGTLRNAGLEVRPDDLFPGRERFYVDDPFGNRIEFLGPKRASTRPHPFTPGAWYRARRPFGVPSTGSSFAEGEVIRFVRPGSFSRRDEVRLYLFENTAGEVRELWWYDSDGPEFLSANLEPVWPPDTD